MPGAVAGTGRAEAAAAAGVAAATSIVSPGAGTVANGISSSNGGVAGQGQPGGRTVAGGIQPAPGTAPGGGVSRRDAAGRRSGAGARLEAGEEEEQEEEFSIPGLGLVHEHWHVSKCAVVALRNRCLIFVVCMCVYPFVEFSLRFAPSKTICGPASNAHGNQIVRAIFTCIDSCPQVFIRLGMWLKRFSRVVLVWTASLAFTLPPHTHMHLHVNIPSAILGPREVSYPGVCLVTAVRSFEGIVVASSTFRFSRGPVNASVLPNHRTASASCIDPSIGLMERQEGWARSAGSCAAGGLMFRWA